MKKIKQYWGSIVVCLAELLIGILLWIDPNAFNSAILMVTGAILLVTGIVSIIQYFRIDAATAMLENDLAKGMLLVGIGLLLCFFSDWLIGIFPLMTVFYGAVSLIVGLVKIQGVVNRIRMHAGGWVFPAINALLTVLFSIVVLFNPFAATVVLFRFLAAALIVVAVLDGCAVCWMMSGK